MRRNLTILCGLAIGLSACGSSEPGRTSGGMATGAGTGAVIGLIGGPIGVVVGAAVGAGAGALTATNTSPSTVNLGDPVWSHPPGVPVSPGAAGATPTAANDGGLPPPQPLPGNAAYAPPTPGATPLPLDQPIQSQPLQPAP